MPFTRDDLRESVERAGDEHWDALRRHHEDAYPNPKPTPGDVCKGEAERLNQLGLGDAKEFELLETRAERVGGEPRLPRAPPAFRATRTPSHHPVPADSTARLLPCRRRRAWASGWGRRLRGAAAGRPSARRRRAPRIPGCRLG